MFKSERLHRIKELVYNHGQVNVTTLSSLLNVSEVTIRTDLEKLENAGFLKRVRGGAVLNEEYSSQQDLDDALACRSIEYDRNLEDIAKISVRLIHDNERIFLGPGKTCYFIAKELLSRRNLTVLTNNLFVANILAANPYITQIMTGGRFVRKEQYYFDELFNRSIENLYLSKAFFTVGGADMNAGYTVRSSSEADIYRSIAERTKEPIVVIDYTKYDTFSFIKLGDLDMVRTVISNDKMPDTYKNYYSENNVRVFTSCELDSL